MKKRVFLICSILMGLFLISNLSAEIIFNQPVNEVYNFGDSINVPVSIKAVAPISDNFRMNLICNDKIINFYKTDVNIGMGEQKDLEGTINLNKQNLGVLSGNCKIQAVLGNGGGDKGPVLSNQFKLSELLIIKSSIDKVDYNPGESLTISGNAIKENGNNANGFIKMQFVTGNQSNIIEQLGTINNGYFSVSVALPENTAAGNYLVKLDAYEVDLNNEQINKGFVNYNINVKQVPKSLEIAAESYFVEPGNVLRVKSILHDQTGEKIEATSIITVKKSKTDILQQVEKPTDEYLEVEIPYNEPPANWTIFGVSSMLDAETNIVIKEKKEIAFELVNESVVIINKGNVPYNGSVILKIGENPLNVLVYLDVDESKEYKLTAPNGQYQVEVISEGQKKISESVLLTGKAIDVRESGVSNINIGKFLVWFFAVLVFAGVVFIVYRKINNRRRYGGFKKKHTLNSGNSLKSSMNSGHNLKSESQVSSLTPVKMQLNTPTIMNLGNKAVLSLSIKGEKHEASIVCLRIRNLGEIRREGIKDTMDKIESLADSKRVFIYENQESLYFIFSPVKTKTFANEKAAIQLSQEINEAVTNHNKLFKYKMDYGISIHTGYIVSKINNRGELEFMGMGNIIPTSKKIANAANQEILLSKEAKEKAGAMIKPQEKTIDGMKVYSIREMREREQYKSFIGAFLRNQERDEAERKKREERFG